LTWPQILTDEISAIPDVVVTYAPIDLSTPAVAEPTIVVEVLSPSSEADDTLRKWFSYRKIASLKHYLVLAQDRRLVQIHSRAGELWRERFVSEGAIELDDPPLHRCRSPLCRDRGGGVGTRSSTDPARLAGPPAAAPSSNQSTAIARRRAGADSLPAAAIRARLSRSGRADPPLPSSQCSP
jgi:hypothetical protein